MQLRRTGRWGGVVVAPFERGANHVNLSALPGHRIAFRRYTFTHPCAAPSTTDGPTTAFETKDKGAPQQRHAGGRGGEGEVVNIDLTLVTDAWVHKGLAPTVTLATGTLDCHFSLRSLVSLMNDSLWVFVSITSSS